jgi:protein SCO1
MLRLFCVLNLALFAFAAGAQGTNSTGAAPESRLEIHPAKGVVIEVSPVEKKVTIKHEDIPGYMHGMTMPFDVKDTNELAGLQPGEPVSFRIVVSGNYGWIDRIRKLGAPTNLPPPVESYHFSKVATPLNEGDLLPDYHFTNQLGQAVSTAQFKGQALAITFLFTRCPFPNFCPLMANNFAATQKKLLAMRNAPTNWHLLIISFDPEFDTPAVLRQYAEAHGADPSRWTFATGALSEITAIGEQFGLAFWKEQGGIISHNLRTVVIDASGRVQKIFTGNDWQPEDLVAEMITAAKVRR